MQGACRCYRGWTGVDCSRRHPLGDPAPRLLPDWASAGAADDDEEGQLPSKPLRVCLVTAQTIQSNLYDDTVRMRRYPQTDERPTKPPFLLFVRSLRTRRCARCVCGCAWSRCRCSTLSIFVWRAGGVLGPADVGVVFGVRHASVAPAASTYDS